MTAIYDFTVRDAEGNEISLSEFRGKVLLIVNTATRCSFTPQYRGLQELYAKYHEQGFEILDFPCNQFMKRAPDEVAQIVAECQANFGSAHRFFEKIEVNGENAHPLFRWLVTQKTQDKGGVAFQPTLATFAMVNGKIPEGDIQWNFTKFLIDREGNVVERFSPGAIPSEIEEDLKNLLS